MSESGPLKISIIVTVANFGGAQIAALRLARGLRDRGHDPKVLFLYGQTPIPAPDHPYTVLAPTAKPGTLGYLRITRDLLRMAVRHDWPAVVLTFLPLASIVGQAGALLAGTRRRIVSHRNPVTTITPLLRGLDALWAWLGIYSDVVAVSESVNRTCRYYPSRLRRRSVVVHNGLRGFHRSRLISAEARRRLGVAEDRFTLVAVGRLAPQKNYPLMLKVMNRLDNATLLIAGDGPLKTELEDTIARSWHRIEGSVARGSRAGRHSGPARRRRRVRADVDIRRTEQLGAGGPLRRSADRGTRYPGAARDDRRRRRLLSRRTGAARRCRCVGRGDRATAQRSGSGDCGEGNRGAACPIVWLRHHDCGLRTGTHRRCRRDNKPDPR